MAIVWPPTPYRPGNGIDPPYLGDREEQIEAVRGFLKNPKHPRNVLITGLRGVGKTVLLNRMQGEAESARMQEETKRRHGNWPDLRQRLIARHAR